MVALSWRDRISAWEIGCVDSWLWALAPFWVTLLLLMLHQLYLLGLWRWLRPRRRAKGYVEPWLHAHPYPNPCSSDPDPDTNLNPNPNPNHYPYPTGAPRATWTRWCPLPP